MTREGDEVGILGKSYDEVKIRGVALGKGFRPECGGGIEETREGFGGGQILMDAGLQVSTKGSNDEVLVNNGWGSV